MIVNPSIGIERDISICISLIKAIILIIKQISTISFNKTAIIIYDNAILFEAKLSANLIILAKLIKLQQLISIATFSVNP